MPEAPEALLARLDALGIAHRTVAHPPVFTVEESKALRPALPGGHSKKQMNMVWTERKERNPMRR